MGRNNRYIANPGKQSPGFCFKMPAHFKALGNCVSFNTRFFNYFSFYL